MIFLLVLLLFPGNLSYAGLKFGGVVKAGKDKAKEIDAKVPTKPKTTTTTPTPTPTPSPTPAAYDLSVAPGFDDEMSYSEVASTGIKRTNIYYFWAEIEQTPNAFTFDNFMADINEASSANLKINLIISLTNTAPKATSLTGAYNVWLASAIPSDLVSNFDGFNKEPHYTRYKNFMNELLPKISPFTNLTYFFVGNETNAFLTASGTVTSEYFSGLLEISTWTKARVAAITVAKPKVGCVFTFPGLSGTQSGSTYASWMSSLASNLDVMGWTFYPTDGEWDAGGTPSVPVKVTPTRQLFDDWINRAKTLAGTTPFVLTETGHSSGATYGSESEQVSYINLLLEAVDASSSNIKAITWWSYHDSPLSRSDIFKYMGLKTSGCTDVSVGCSAAPQDRNKPKPAYTTWSTASKAR